MKKCTAIDLFSGCGGLTLGLKLAGFRIVAAVDNDQLATTTYRLNHPRIPVWDIDIVKVRARAMMRQLAMRPGDLDLLAGCPPCQGFSVLRTHNGALQRRDRRNGLIKEMLRFVRAFEPKAIMLENVPGLGEHQSFQKLCTELRRLGYCIRWDIKDARHYGVPQRRKRLILVGGRGFEIPFAPESRVIRTVRHAIGNLPKPGTTCDALHNVPEKRSTKVRAIIRAIPKDGGSRADLPNSLQLACHQRLDGFSDIYGRMAWDEPSPTITSGCFNPSKGRFLHPEDDRAITLREAALLQTFPPTYTFPARNCKEAVALMIGNALPPAFTQKHAKQIIEALKQQEEVRPLGGRQDA
jgi:DNA (cytosine-5)-methyltransferase 1